MTYSQVKKCIQLQLQIIHFKTKRGSHLLAENTRMWPHVLDLVAACVAWVQRELRRQISSIRQPECQPTTTSIQRKYVYSLYQSINQPTNQTTSRKFLQPKEYIPELTTTTDQHKIDRWWTAHYTHMTASKTTKNFHIKCISLIEQTAAEAKTGPPTASRGI